MLHNLKSKLQEASKHNFTFEIEVKRQMPFLDSSITRNSEGGFTTKAHVKPTSSADVVSYWKLRDSSKFHEHPLSNASY